MVLGVDRKDGFSFVTYLHTVYVEIQGKTHLYPLYFLHPLELDTEMTLIIQQANFNVKLSRFSRQENSSMLNCRGFLYE